MCPSRWPDDLIAVCRKYADMAPEGAMVREPYLPHVPQSWNGVLVLAESQQLAGAKSYRAWLEKLSREQRFVRLELWESSDVGVGPWDSGPVKLALKAIMPGICTDEVAVGNAVPWSCCTEAGTNANPTAPMRQKAAEFWRDLLSVWRPQFRAVALLGKVARQVLARAGLTGAVKLRLPSPNNLRRICGMFDKDDLLERYPEVKAAGEALGDKLDKLSDVFFACHAVSLGRRQLRELRANTGAELDTPLPPGRNRTGMNARGVRASLSSRTQGPPVPPA